jgi:hypothetical protein
MKRRTAAAAALGVLVLTGCGNPAGSTEGDTAMSLTGTCTVSAPGNPRAIISETSLQQALGSGSYAVSGVLSVDQRGVPSNGHCDFTPADRTSLELVTVGLASSTDPEFTAARSTMKNDARVRKLPDGDGYVLPETGQDGDGKPTKAARAVLFEGDRMVVVALKVPGEGVNATTEAPRLAKEAATQLRQP